MAEFKHATMRQSTQPNTQPATKHYEVEDVSAQPSAPASQRPSAFDMVTQAPQQTAPPPVQLPQETTNILESLLFLGRLYDDVVIGNITFKLATLNSKESESLMNILTNNSDNPLTVKNYSVAYSLKAINGISIENLPIVGNFATIHDRSFAIVSELQHAVTDKLFKHYDLLMSKSQQFTDGEEIKN